MEAGTIILRHGPGGGESPETTAWTRFERPAGRVIAHAAKDVPEALERIARHARAGGWAAGYLAYEAAAGFDPAFATHAARIGEPLLWFGLYEEPRPCAEPQNAATGQGEGKGDFAFEPWRASITAGDYAARIARIREHIAAGDTYQVNFCYLLESRFAGDAGAMFAALRTAGRGGYAALIETGERTIASFSPELFFAQRGDAVVTRPMKGTAPRGLRPAEDDAAAARLAASAKDRAENVMIVDLLRNDLGRIARPGSVAAGPLFTVERYPTLLQMTSTVRALTDGDPIDTLRALFPCGSITGAPKINTMRIIAAQEGRPRGVYTGAIGWIGPDRRALFNVAIRTIEIERDGRARYGVGGGVTWGSTPEGEWEETQTKSLPLLRPRGAFELLETLRWTPEEGYALRERHLARMEASARYFDFAFDRGRAERELDNAARGWGDEARRVRLLSDARGALRMEHTEMTRSANETGAPARWRACFAAQAVDSRDVFLYHKTTLREVYDAARRAHPACDEVILRNERGEVTEGTVSNVVAELEGRKWTPPLVSGLLAGTLRGELIEHGEIAERVLMPEDLRRATRLWFVNSVRGWVQADLII